MLKKTGFAVLLYLALANPGFTQDEPDRGQLLYENHCRKCHDASVHQRTDRKAIDVIKLNQFVIRWQYDQKLDWSYDEIREVVNYLNKTYYHFESRP